MRHKMGGGRASYSRKASLVLQMRLRRCSAFHGMTLAQACADTAHLYRLRLADLEDMNRAEAQQERAGTLRFS